jgi:hypothetical protein
MRALLITATVVGGAIVLGGCPNKKPQPVPGPQSACVTVTRGVLCADAHDSPAPGSRTARPQRPLLQSPRLGL